MSNRRRPRNAYSSAVRSSRPMPTPRPGEEYAAQPALIPNRATGPDVDFARKISHDALIEAWGDLRRSRIWWTEYSGARAAKVYRDLHAGADTPITPEAEAHLDNNPALCVVVAWAIVKRGTPTGTLAPGWVTPEDLT